LALLNLRLTILCSLKKTEKSFIALLIYVDDIVLVGNDLNVITTGKESLNVAFHIKDLGKLKYFMRLEISHS